MTETTNKKRETLRIVTLCVFAAIAYGIAHDLVTAHLCVEYFTVGHPPVFATENPVLLAIGWGVIATWWVGFLLGWPLAFAALRGRRPVRTARSLIPPLVKLLTFMAAFAALAGVLGHLFARAGWISPQWQGQFHKANTPGSSRVCGPTPRVTLWASLVDSCWWRRSDARQHPIRGDIAWGPAKSMATPSYGLPKPSLRKRARKSWMATASTQSANG